MFALVLNSIRANKARFFLTGVAVMLGVAFMTGTLVLTDTIKKSYDEVAANVYKSSDAVVRSDRHVDGGDRADTRGTVAAATLGRVRSVPGVKLAEAQQLGIASVVGHDGDLLDANRERAVPIGLAWQSAHALNPLELVAGHAPRAPDEIVVDRASMRAGHFHLGETVAVLSQRGTQPYRLAGVATYGGRDSAAGAQVVAFTPETASTVLGTPGRVTAIEVVAESGVSQSQLATALRRALPDRDVEVLTGAAAAKDARNAAGKSMQFMNMFLMTFAVVALVVGSFVIYNTFSITVAQRTKETALLRAIGAKRKQVTRSVMVEALLTGVFASAVGVVAGLGAAQGLRAVLGAFGLELPGTGSVVAPATLVISATVGVVVTVLAAYLPARKAAKVAPIEALRDAAVDRSSASRRRAVVGTLMAAGGGYAIASGLDAHAIGTVGIGAASVFVALVVLGPVIARPLSRALGVLLPRFRGMPGTLARENASRNPRRTASAASALMIGVALVAFMTVFAASAKASLATSVDKAMKADWIVETQFGMGGMSPDVTKRIDALPETGAVTALRYLNTTVAGAVKNTSAVDPGTAEQTIDFRVRSGSIGELGKDTVAVQTDEAKARHLHVGDTVSMTFAETGPQSLRVAAIYDTKDPMGPYTLSTATVDANVTRHVDDHALVNTAPGVSEAQARTAINRVLDDSPNAKLLTRDEFKGDVANQINKVLNLVYVLLAMALVIALFGIANTLALSVFERTREFGLLRAVGMARAQVRASVRWESVLISLLGTTLGTALGLGLSWALIRAASGTQLAQLSIPVRELAVIIAVAAAAAVLAAALPARRAARLDVLRAIQTGG
ncbi:MAG: ABC transporter permease [Acidimicrobiia bacterium]